MHRGSHGRARVFELYVEHFLAPCLGEGQVVVMDNLGAHRPKRIRELIEARGGRARRVLTILFAGAEPRIEQAFSKIKNILRKLGARTHEALLEAIEEALSKLTPLRPQDSSVIAATRSRFSTCEHRC